VKSGEAPSELEMAKLLVAQVDKRVAGSLSSLRVSSPVLTRVVVTWRSLTSRFDWGALTEIDKDLVADTAETTVDKRTREPIMIATRGTTRGRTRTGR
jgi:hypothetical protein